MSVFATDQPCGAYRSVLASLINSTVCSTDCVLWPDMLDPHWALAIPDEHCLDGMCQNRCVATLQENFQTDQQRNGRQSGITVHTRRLFAGFTESFSLEIQNFILVSLKEERETWLTWMWSQLEWLQMKRAAAMTPCRMATNWLNISQSIIFGQIVFSWIRFQHVAWDFEIKIQFFLSLIEYSSLIAFVRLRTNGHYIIWGFQKTTSFEAERRPFSRIRLRWFWWTNNSHDQWLVSIGYSLYCNLWSCKIYSVNYSSRTSLATIRRNSTSNCSLKVVFFIQSCFQKLIRLTHAEAMVHWRLDFITTFHYQEPAAAQANRSIFWFMELALCSTHPCSRALPIFQYKVQ